MVEPALCQRWLALIGSRFYLIGNMQHDEHRYLFKRVNDASTRGQHKDRVDHDGAVKLTEHPLQPGFTYAQLLLT